MPPLPSRRPSRRCSRGDERALRSCGGRHRSGHSSRCSAFPRAEQDWRARATASFEDAWQTINDTYFDPAFGGVDWQSVRAELAPKVAAAGSEDQVRDAIREMIGRLQQSHFVLLAPAITAERPPGPATVPIEIRLLQNDVVITAVQPDSSAWRAGLRPGQTIRSVDGASLAAACRPARRSHGWTDGVATGRADAARWRPDGGSDRTRAAACRITPASVDRGSAAYARPRRGGHRRQPAGDARANPGDRRAHAVEATGRGHCVHGVDGGGGLSICRARSTPIVTPMASSSICAAIPAGWRR